MRYRRPRSRQTRTKTVIMSGGLNMAVTPLELKEGELYQSKNYMETDASYHGYSSVLGYERFDGKNKASDIGIVGLTDSGSGGDCVLLMEYPSGHTDIIGNHTVVNYGVVGDAVTTKFLGGAFKYNDGYHSINAASAQLNLQDNFTLDFFVRPNARTTTQVLFEKENCYKLSIDTNGYLTFETSDDGLSYTDSIAMVKSGLETTRFSHVSISCKNLEMRMAVEGAPIETAGGAVITTTVADFYEDTTPLIVGHDVAFGATTKFKGWIDEFRLTYDYLWVTDFEIPLARYSTSGYQVINYDDIDREAQRATITEVPGLGPVRGIHVYKGEVYALRNDDPGPGATLYRANRIADPGGGYQQTSGWVAVDTTLNEDGRMQAVNWRFSGSFSDQQVMCIVDGVSVPRVWDGSTMTVLDASYGGGSAASLPDNQVGPRYAKACSIFDNRLILGYEQDDIVLSAKSDPGDFSSGYGGQLLIGDAITNLKELPGEALGIFCRNSIKILKKLETPTATAATPDYTFTVENFSRQAGAFPWTVERALSNIVYADDRGVVALGSTDKYGDFTAEALSKNVNRIYLDKKQQITTSLTDKVLNQYRLYFDDGTALYFTFKKEGLKGVTLIEWPEYVNIACEGEDPDGEIWKFFSGEDGYVYQMDSGTSFDGEEIITSLNTSYYHYGSPRDWKDFRRMVFEVTAVAGTKFYVRGSFNYADQDFPTALWYNPSLKGAGGIWGTDLWGFFLWGGSVVQRIVHYQRGYGSNMSIEMKTASKYVDQHIVHNCIVDYEVGGKQE